MNFQRKPCEVSMCGGAGEPDYDCGKPARINVNGFPMCAQHFDEYENENLVESVSIVTADPPAATETGPRCPTCNDARGAAVVHALCPDGWHVAEQAPRGALLSRDCDCPADDTARGIHYNECMPGRPWKRRKAAPQGAPPCGVEGCVLAHGHDCDCRFRTPALSEAEANRVLAARLGATMTAGVVVTEPQGAPPYAERCDHSWRDENSYRYCWKCGADIDPSAGEVAK